MVEPGDWTGPGGAQQILARRDIDVAVLETARGGIVLRGVGYESNDASVLTNVSSDHLDLQGIHTLPELAEVKSTICRITKPDGWVVLNADDPLVAAVARRVTRQRRVLLARRRCVRRSSRRHRARGGRAYLVRDGVARRGRRRDARPRSSRSAAIPITIGGLARHNVANALAAAGGARGLGATIEQVRDGLLRLPPDAERSPGRLNLFRARRRGSSSSTSPTTRPGSRPCSTSPRGSPPAPPAGPRRSPRSSGPPATGRTTRCAGIGRIAAERAQRVAIKQTLKYLRGRTAESVVGELLAGVVAGGGDAADVPIYDSETAALRAELNGAAGHGPSGGRGARGSSC